MAYISAQQLDEDDDRQSRGEAALSADAGGLAPAAPPPKGSKFVGFGRYLAANRDAAKAYADRQTSAAQAQGDAAQGALNTAQANFASLAAAPTTAYMDADERAGDSTPNWDANQYAAANATYKGADSLAQTPQWQALQAQALQAQDTASAGPQGSAFDKALLGSAGADQYAALREKYGKLSGALETANTKSAGQAQAGRQATQAAASAAQAQYAQRDAEQQAQKDEAARLRAIAEDESRSEAERRAAAERYNILAQAAGTALFPVLGAPGAVGWLGAKINDLWGKK